MISSAMDDEEQQQKQEQQEQQKQQHLPTPPASVTHPDQPASVVTMSSRAPLQFMDLSVDIKTLIISHVSVSSHPTNLGATRYARD
jgi:hypothetical protein